MSCYLEDSFAKKKNSIKFLLEDYFPQFVNNYVFLAIPIIVGVFTGYYLFTINNEIQSNTKSELLFSSQKLIENGSPVIGNPSAPITILEWGDYQCTFCFRFHQSSLKFIHDDYIETGKVKLVFKDFPLNGPDSILAAESAYCAQDQGKYWEYHDELYTNWAGERTGWITRDSLNLFAQKIELNLSEFNSCLDEKKHNQRVLSLEEFGREIGIDATPSFLIFNSEKVIKIRGNQPLEVFKRVIDSLEF